MRIVVLGTRGFPGVQGGVEKHCENLYPILVKYGCEVIVFSRKPYVPKGVSFYQGVKLIPLYCPQNKFLEAFYHTFWGVLAAKRLKPDILHVHAVGPSLLIPFAKLLGLKVVMTNHGHDYERKKWNWFGKFSLRKGEAWGSKRADEIICISKRIADKISKDYNRQPHVIPNGVVMPDIAQTQEALKKYGLKERKYILAVGRFVPEKGFEDLIEAFKQWQQPGASSDVWKLAIVGGADHEDKYSKQLQGRAAGTPGVVLTGRLTGRPLQELYSYAGLFVLPSYYEGLPIVLLEAMSYGLSCIVSDIPANREVALPQERFFRPGDSKQLIEKINRFANFEFSSQESSRQIAFISENFNWDKIAKETLKVYGLIAKT